MWSKHAIFLLPRKHLILLCKLGKVSIQFCLATSTEYISLGSQEADSGQVVDQGYIYGSSFDNSRFLR